MPTVLPTRDQIVELWNKYALPAYKRHHCQLVSRVAVWFAHELAVKGNVTGIDVALLESAALLHDIDKMAQKNAGEHHPDAGVRILKDEGFPEVADLVRTHPLHAILDQNISPKTWEQKILYLSDKMTKHDIITVDERFALWRKESLPQEAVFVLDATYPMVKALEEDICAMIRVAPKDIALLVNATETSTMMKDS